MRNLLKILSERLTVVAAALLIALPSTAAPKGDQPRDPELDDMTFLEMLNSVELGKASQLVQKFQNKEGMSRLINGKYNQKGGCTVEAYRNKEVLLVTVPASLLFGPNETTLKPGASEYLQPLRRYLKDPDMYRVMIVMHTDNTGSSTYRDRITEERANAVFDWFEDSGVDTRYLFSYAMGDDMPVYPNDSMENREKNRRLEIYLVPGKKMLEQARKGRIAF